MEGENKLLFIAGYICLMNSNENNEHMKEQENKLTSIVILRLVLLIAANAFMPKTGVMKEESRDYRL